MTDNNIWFESNPKIYKGLSNKACALMLPMFYSIDEENAVHKNQFRKTVTWIKDPRTLNIYWNELVDKEFLVHLKKKIWMVSPHICYKGSTSYSELLEKWNEACFATVS